MSENENEISVKATWWEDDGSEHPPTEDVELKIAFDGDCFYIDGLRDGTYLSLPFKEVAKAIVAGL